MNKQTLLGKLLHIQQGVQFTIDALMITNENSLTPEQWEKASEILTSTVPKFKELTTHVLTSLTNAQQQSNSKSDSPNL